MINLLRRGAQDPLTGDRDTLAVEQALLAAAIPPEHRGSARLSRLSPAERRFYLWILERFAAANPPDGNEAQAAATVFGVDQDAFAVFAREDLVHTDASGRPTVANPFSATPRGHRVLIDGAQWVDAMCAIDALGIGPMLGLPIEVISRDPLNGGEVRVRLDADDEPWWEPSEAVVLAGSTDGEGPSFRGCCDVLNFFVSAANAELYLHEHPDWTPARRTFERDDARARRTARWARPARTRRASRRREARLTRIPMGTAQRSLLRRKVLPKLLPVLPDRGRS